MLLSAKGVKGRAQADQAVQRLHLALRGWHLHPMRRHAALVHALQRDVLTLHVGVRLLQGIENKKTYELSEEETNRLREEITKYTTESDLVSGTATCAGGHEAAGLQWQASACRQHALAAAAALCYAKLLEGYGRRTYRRRCQADSD